MHPESVQLDLNCDLLWFYLFFPYFPFFGMCVNLHNLIWDHCAKTISPNVSMFSSIEIFIINSTEFKTMRTNHSTPIDMWRVKQVFVLEMSAWVQWNLIILEAYLHPNGTVVSKDSCSFAKFIKILISWLPIDTFRENKPASHVCFTVFFQPIGHESFWSQSFHSVILNSNVNIQKRCENSPLFSCFHEAVTSRTIWPSFSYAFEWWNEMNPLARTFFDSGCGVPSFFEMMWIIESYSECHFIALNIPC